MIKLTYVDDGSVINLVSKQFAPGGGEQNPKLLDHTVRDRLLDVHARLYNGDDVMELVMVVDAIRRQSPRQRLRLTMPYIPYARQDRVCNEGESLGVVAFAQIINSLNLNAVYVWDAHSDVAVAAIDRCYNVPAAEFLYHVREVLPPSLSFVAPDAGAEKRVKQAADWCRVKYITATKVREPHTGNPIPHIESLETVGDGPLMIVDDICDGGRTFVNLGKVLQQKTSRPLYLYVTHGIFSYGTAELGKIFNRIYTPHPWPNVDLTTGLIREII